MNQSPASTQECRKCFGSGYVESGIDEAPGSICNTCEGCGVVPAQSPASSKASELLNCPFCGSTDVGGGSGVVACYVCKCATKKYETTAEAADAWNRRAPLAPVAPDALDERTITIAMVAYRDAVLKGQNLYGCLEASFRAALSSQHQNNQGESQHGSRS